MDNVFNKNRRPDIMGVQIRDIVPREELAIDALAKKTVAIDAMNWLFQFLAIIRGRDGTPLMDSLGRVTSHLSGVFYRTTKLIEAGIKPVYVFDGEPHPLKAATVAGRREARIEAAEKWKAALEAGEEAEARKYAQASSRVTSDILDDSKKLLDAMGVPWVQAPGEGEAQAAHMCASGHAYAVGSQDFDSLLFGAPLLARNLSVTGKRKIPGREAYVDVKPEIISLEKTLSSLKMTREQLVAIGVLVGTDFNPGIHGVGQKRALEFIKKHGTIERVLAENKKLDWGYAAATPSEIEDIFLKPNVTDEYALKWGSPDEETLVNLLCGEHDFSEERVRKAAREMIGTKRETEAQKELNKWF